MNSNELKEKSIGNAYQMNMIEDSGYDIAGIRDDMVMIFSRAYQDKGYRNAVAKDIDVIMYHLDNAILYIMQNDKQRVLRSLGFAAMISGEATKYD